jgi:hypothetical protein
VLYRVNILREIRNQQHHGPAHKNNLNKSAPASPSYRLPAELLKSNAADVSTLRSRYSLACPSPRARVHRECTYFIAHKSPTAVRGDLSCDVERRALAAAVHGLAVVIQTGRAAGRGVKRQLRLCSKRCRSLNTRATRMAVCQKPGVTIEYAQNRAHTWCTTCLCIRNSGGSSLPPIVSLHSGVTYTDVVTHQPLSKNNHNAPTSM